MNRSSIYIPPAARTLAQIASKIAPYGGLANVILGLFGNSVNIIMFSMTKLKKSPCSLYLLVTDLCNTLTLLVGLLPIIIPFFDGYDNTEQNLIWCRIHSFLYVVLQVISIGTLCEAAVDRFNLTSRSVRRRAWSSMKIAKISIAITIVVSLSINLVDLVYKNCNYRIPVKPKAYKLYMEYFVLLTLTTLLPILILLVFTCLIYRNLKIIRTNTVIYRSSNESQLVSLLIIQAICFIVAMCTSPIYQFYDQITGKYKKSAMRIAIELFIKSFLVVLHYTYLSSSFYIYYISSRSYRNTVNEKFSKIIRACCKSLMEMSDTEHTTKSTTLKK
jgi:hypothetical protein